jgi:signal transduction histidine kinase/DNA-binding response OmpR family regulator
VLVVDDVGSRRHQVVEALRAEGFVVVAADCGSAALDAAIMLAPDAVVIDVCRPQWKGVETCRALKKAAPGLLPVLHLSSAMTSSETRAAGLDAGADGYLSHPFDTNELRAAVSALVRLKHQVEERSAEATVSSLLHEVLDALPYHVALLDSDGDVIGVNRAWADFASSNGHPEGKTGYGANYFEIGEGASGLGVADARAAAAGIARVLAGEISSFALEYPCRAPCTDRWFQMEVREMPRRGSVAAIITHVERTREHIAAVAKTSAFVAADAERQRAACERERLMASLEVERSRLAAIFQEAPTFLAVLRGPDYVFERVNPAYLLLVGQRNPVGMRLADALPEIAGQGFVEILDQVRLTGEPFLGRRMPVQLERLPGAALETRYVDMAYQRLTDADGGFALVAHGVDVTDEVLATQALRRSEKRLRDQFEKLPVPTYLWERMDGEFMLLDWNEAAHRASPHLGNAAILKKSSQLFPGIEGIDEEFQRCLSENVVIRRNVQLDLGAPLGQRVYDLTIGPQQPDHVLVHFVDTTEHTELEAQLRQAQKMDAVGRLAGGVAHDFNNLLTVISAHSVFLLESIAPTDPRREDVEAIHDAGIRAAGLTRQLLAFSRKQILRPVVLDLNTVIGATRNMLGRLLGDDIDIVMSLDPHIGRVIADATQIDQVVVNLAVNARDAMPDGGRVTITTRNASVGAEMTGARRIIPPGDYVLLDVTDTGVGMDAAVQARLFEPFFTTKAVGSGTGLGLATVYGIVKQSAGYILVESTPSRGTSFQVYLPLVSEHAELDECRVAESAAAGGVETVLLVEDEPAVRQIARRVLVRQGYVVLEAANGAEALAISRSFASAIHLVVSDAVMPGIGAAEVVRRLKEQRPSLKVLIMSGYTDDEMVRRGIVTSSIPFVQKPFELSVFARAVRDALDG